MPKFVDHELRRAEIARAFWRVLIDRGIAGATTREIARASGGSMGTLAHYFGHKDGLLLGSFDLLVETFRGRLSRAARDQTSALASLEAVALAALPLDAARLIESGVWMSFWAHGYSHVSLRTRQREAYGQWIALLAAGIARGQAAGEIRLDVEPREAATAFAALIDGLTVQLVLRGKAELPLEAVTSNIRSHLRGFMQFPAVHVGHGETSSVGMPESEPS